MYDLNQRVCQDQDHQVFQDQCQTQEFALDHHPKIKSTDPSPDRFLWNQDQDQYPQTLQDLFQWIQKIVSQEINRNQNPAQDQDQDQDPKLKCHQNWDQNQDQWHDQNQDQWHDQNQDQWHDQSQDQGHDQSQDRSRDQDLAQLKSQGWKKMIEKRPRSEY